MIMAQLASVRTASASVSMSAVRRGRVCWFYRQLRMHQQEACPVYGDTCLQCNGRSHLKKMCPENKNKEKDEKKSTYKKDEKKSYEAPHKPPYKGKDIQDSEDKVTSQFVHMTLDTITMASIDKKTKVTEKWDEAIKTKVDSEMIADIRVKVDTGAQDNTLPLRMFRKLYRGKKKDKCRIPKPDIGKDRHTTLTAYGGKTLPNYGTVTLPCGYKG